MDWDEAAAGTGSYHEYPLSPGIGQEELTATYNPTETRKSIMSAVWGVASVAGAAAGAYHGYKRNQSIGWAFVWALAGSVAPVITVPVAFAQGFGKPKRG